MRALTMKVTFIRESQQFSHSAQTSVHYANAFNMVPTGQRATVTFCLTATCRFTRVHKLQCRKGEILLLGYCLYQPQIPGWM